MQLISILVIIVATLTLLTGITVIFGAKPRERLFSILFFNTVLCASLWAYSVIAFLNLPATATDAAPVLVATIYISALAMVIAMFGYAASFVKCKFGTITSIIIAAIGTIFSLIIIFGPNLLYSSITLSAESGNAVHLQPNLFYVLYLIFFALVFVLYGALLIRKILQKPPAAIKNTAILLLVGPGICGIVSLCFDLLLPFTRYDLIWVGPISIDIAIITFYYAILRYRMIVVRNVWMRIMSYAVFITTLALVYILLLLIVAALIFPSVNLTIESLILDFIMIVIVLILLPILANLASNVRSLLSVKTIDLAYLIKRIDKIEQSNPNIASLTVLLADHLHFSYIGIVLDNHLHSSKEVPFGLKEIEIGAIENKNMPDRIWDLLKNQTDQPAPTYTDLRAIVDLRAADGKAFGRIIFGIPHDDRLTDDDITRLEMVISLVATAIDPEKKSRTTT